MKPTFHQTQTNHRRDSRTALRTGNGLPKTDYHFRPNSLADFNGRCHGSPAPSFRRISDDYFKNEASGQFITEAVTFGLIVVAAAVPLVQGVRGAITFLHAVGVL